MVGVVATSPARVADDWLRQARAAAESQSLVIFGLQLELPVAVPSSYLRGRWSRWVVGGAAESEVVECKPLKRMVAGTAHRDVQVVPHATTVDGASWD